MNNFTKEEKMGLLTRGLTRRLVGANPAIAEKEHEIERIDEVRKSITDRLEMYKDDDYIVRMLQSQITQFDREYSGAKQNYVMAIEEIKKSEPKVKKLLEILNNIKVGSDMWKMLDILLDLFFLPILTDWKELESELEKQKQNKEIVNGENK